MAQEVNMPKRIQRKRAKGWKMPAGAVYVGRPTVWGNPFQHGNAEYAIAAYLRYILHRLGEDVDFGWVTTSGQWITKKQQLPVTVRIGNTYSEGENDGRRKPFLFRPFDGFEESLRLVDIPNLFFQDIEDLRGRDLVCWCPLDKPCHADVLLELANK